MKDNEVKEWHMTSIIILQIKKANNDQKWFTSTKYVKFEYITKYISK